MLTNISKCLGRFKEELIYGTSAELIRKYFTPKPFVKPQQEAEALNEDAAEILAEEAVESNAESKEK